ncbi:hypothetical protein J4Q44_G00319710 [Coregonus suidteri]|uniref:Transcription cofactor vestigial-like protein 2 n=1 Tax=Coregonus suidteri TaxID=861788 RepID=A0AAN8KTC9_9TELE
MLCIKCMVHHLSLILPQRIAHIITRREYLNSRCVLFTYFHGDISSVVDEHFSRALSQPTSYVPGSASNKSARVRTSRSSLEQCLRILLLRDTLPWGLLLLCLPTQPPPPGHPRALGTTHTTTTTLTHSAGPSAPRAPPTLDPACTRSTARTLTPATVLCWCPLCGHIGSLHPLSPGPAPRRDVDIGKSESASSAWTGAFTGAGADISQSIGLNVDAGLQPQDKSKDLYWF